MKRRWLVIPATVAAVVGLLWIILGGGRVDTTALTRMFSSAPPAKLSGKPKPICSQVIVPAGTDCIPQHLANLPPDPGPAGMKTIEGIDSDKDGVRDDVQRYIAENYGHSERAVKALTNIAKSMQVAVLVGDSVSREEAQELARPMVNAGSCYSRTAAADPALRKTNALEKVEAQVTNTPERFKRARGFEYKAAHTVYALPDAPTPELCGFDPAQLPS